MNRCAPTKRGSTFRRYSSNNDGTFGLCSLVRDDTRLAVLCYKMLQNASLSYTMLCYPVVLFSAGTRLLNLPTGLTVSAVGEIRRRSPCAGPSRPDADLRPGVHARLCVFFGVNTPRLVSALTARATLLSLGRLK